MPGPGQYSPYLWPRPSPCKFPKSERDVRGSRFDLKPGPGTYFVSEVRQRPGGYAVDSLRRSAPAVTITCRHFESSNNGGPAPGDYQPSLALVRSSSPQFTFRGVTPKVGDADADADSDVDADMMLMLMFMFCLDIGLP